jgi:ATP-dependent Zn protease
MDQILSMSARSLPPEARRQIAIHEAGHAVFFGLGESVPEDLYTWLDDEIPALDDIAAGQGHAGGAVSAFTALTEKAIALDLHKKEQLVLLGMLCGGAAAETIVYGDPSAGMVMDAAAFEAKARLFLALYPDSRWPYFMQPATELEVRANATSLGAFRDHVLGQSQQFLLHNRAALDRVAEALLEKGELDVENLRRLLPGVVPAAGFERFSWPPDVPAMQYLRS